LSHDKKIKKINNKDSPRRVLRLKKKRTRLFLTYINSIRRWQEDKKKQMENEIYYYKRQLAAFEDNKQKFE
jgi:hypothetical protein